MDGAGSVWAPGPSWRICRRRDAVSTHGYDAAIRLLLSTPLYLFLFDLQLNTLTELRSGDGEYYGLTWTPDTLFFGRSRIDNEAVVTHEQAVVADRGDVIGYDTDGQLVATTPRHLLLAHQIEWTDDSLLAVDTGHERICVYAADGSLTRCVALGGLDWDRGPRGLLGHHFNSVHRTKDRVWIVAHNHDRQSQVWELSWPDLQLSEIHPTGAEWAHNAWETPWGLVVCDSRTGNLHEVQSGKAIWESGEDGVVTRGLAVSDAYLFVGRSEYGDRGARLCNDGGLWILDRTTFLLIEQFRFPGSGCINEIRLLDPVDECHNGVPFNEQLLTALTHPS
jgi:hypothetical protein